MKKIVPLLLILCLLSGVCPVQAATLDLSPVLESESLVLQVDAARDLAFISCDKVLSVADRHFEHKYEHPRLWSYIASDIIIANYSTEAPFPVMQTWIYYQGTKAIHADSVTFRVNGRDYTLTGVGSDTRRGENEGGVYETLGIIYGADTQPFLSALFDYQSGMLSEGNYGGEVLMVLHGAEEDVVTRMNAKALMDLFIIGSVFSEINGFEYFGLTDGGTPMTAR